jgi:hypothetical protein
LNQFINQLPALIGVVIGASASYLATSVGAKTQWARSERVRWEDKRIQIYADYGLAVKRVYELSKRICAERGFPTTAPPIPVEQGLTELSLASIRRAELWETLLLLSDPSAIEAAGAWHAAVWRMESFATGQHTDPVQWREVVTAADEKRRRFYDIARQDLGISGPLPDRRTGKPPIIPSTT